MKIIRNGQEIELTSKELLAAYEEQQHEYDMQYVGYVLDEYVGYDEVMTPEQISDLAHEFRRRRDNYDFDQIGEIEYELVNNSFMALFGQWTMTDDDCCQMIGRYNVFDYELYQIVELPDEKLCVVHGFVNIIDALDEDDAEENYIKVYGFDSLEEMKKQCGKNWPQILAEQVFEINSLIYPPMFSGTFEECAEFIHKKTGR